MIKRFILGAALAGAVLGSQAAEAMPAAIFSGDTGASVPQANVEKTVVIVGRPLRRRPVVRVVRRRPAVIVR